MSIAAISTLRQAGLRYVHVVASRGPCLPLGVSSLFSATSSPSHPIIRRAYHIGYNGACIRPSLLPQIFRWQNAKGEELLVMAEDNYGRSVRAPNSVEALSFMFQIDNSGPPTALEVNGWMGRPALHCGQGTMMAPFALPPSPPPSPPLPRPSLPRQVIEFWRKQRLRYPKATQLASTLDDYATSVLGNSSVYNSLPVVTEEIGDSWLYGSPADPIKVGRKGRRPGTFGPGGCAPSSAQAPLTGLGSPYPCSWHSTARHVACSRPPWRPGTSAPRPKR